MRIRKRLVVYHGKIDESILSVMYAHAVAKSLEGRAVRYGVIDGDDLNRLVQAYPKEFGLRTPGFRVHGIG